MRRRRTLAGLAAAAAFMTSDGCAFLKGEGCEKKTTDKIYALFIGFACLGARHEPPTAQFTLRPNPVAPGDKVDLDGTRSFAANGDDVVAYDWELDASGAGAEAAEFDDVAGGFVSVAMPLPADGTRSRTIGLRVTDADGRTDRSFHELHFTGRSTAFDVQPDPAIAGRPARFEAAEGPETFSWDFEGNGEFTVPSRERSITHTYLTPGERIVRLRAADAAGQVSEVTRALNVRRPETAGADVSAVARAAARRAHRPRGRRFRAQLRGATLALDPAAMTVSGPVGRIRETPADGRLVVRGRGLRPLRRARWVARLDLTADLRNRAVTLRGTALATLARGRGLACVRLTVVRRGDGVPRGRLRILGGTGVAARLAARARYRVHAANGALRLRGRVRTRTRPPRLPPPGCGRT